LHDRLKEAAAGRSVSEEIRRRLEGSLLYDLAGGQKTREFIDAVGSLTRNIRPYYGRWHENPYAFAVLKAAIDTVLAKVQPRGEPTPPADDGEFRPGDTPEAAGRALATAEIIARGL
jgi:hypothetical protein